MDLKERKRKLKADIPAIFLALKDQETTLAAQVFAGITVGAFVFISEISLLK